ncbi:MAG: DNA-binding response regulator [Sphingobacteriales bacterium]|nr:DNA-binding response regulator [Sphingobacteriales bacterium]
MKILIIEDEQDLSKSIVSYLKEQGYLCETAFDYYSATEKIGLYDYDCILLDITLPGGSGLDLLKYLKANKKSDAVLIISAKNSLDDKIDGLQSGADDYLAKPFHLAELSARLAAIIRRRNFNGSTLIEFNEITIDTSAKIVFIQNEAIELTKKEYELLLYFIINKKRVISKNAIAEHLWGDEIDMVDNFDFLYTHIKNLRKKLDERGCPEYIKSVYGMGYKFSEL